MMPLVRNAASRSARPVRQARPGIERLEDRLAPAWAGAPPAWIVPPPTASRVALTYDGYGCCTGGNFPGGATFVRFVAPLSGRYSFSATTPNSNVNTVIGVFSSVGRRLGFNDNVGPGDTDSQVDVSLQRGHLYYFGITNRIGTPAGTYLWTVQRVPPPGAFRIDVHFGNGLSASQQSAFNFAASRWQRIIVGDVPDATYNGRRVDDLLIEASGKPIDGASGILGQAGPDAFRTGSKLPYHGIMEFDTADLAQMESAGILIDVITHEMGHVLGIGTIWAEKGLLKGAGTDDPRFTGANATAQYNRIFGRRETSVPVENTGGGGTRDSHWRDSVFGNELMTGYIASKGNPISGVTVGSLADMGYRVNYKAAELFFPRVVAAQAASSSAAVPGRHLTAGGPASDLTVNDLAFQLQPAAGSRFIIPGRRRGRKWNTRACVTP